MRYGLFVPLSASEKLAEEVGELLEACIKGNKDEIFEEAGGVLFSAVNTCRLAGADCEEALHAATDKFIKGLRRLKNLRRKAAKRLRKWTPRAGIIIGCLRKMQLKKIKIGKLHTENNIFCAPLAGYTNAPFRDMCRAFGAGLTFTEMVSAKGLCYGSEKTEQLLYVSPDYSGIKACQIFGKEPYYMRKACESKALEPFDLVDINMGCPVPKIYKNGEGSALLNDLHLASEIIKECKKSGKYVSVKFRIGVDGEHIVSRDFATACEDAGADMITVHGRTRDKIYSGEVNFEEIAKAKKAVKIPVIANGGIFLPKTPKGL